MTGLIRVIPSSPCQVCDSLLQVPQASRPQAEARGRARGSQRKSRVLSGPVEGRMCIVNHMKSPVAPQKHTRIPRVNLGDLGRTCSLDVVRMCWVLPAPTQTNPQSAESFSTDPQIMWLPRHDIHGTPILYADQFAWCGLGGQLISIHSSHIWSVWVLFLHSFHHQR